MLSLRAERPSEALARRDNLIHILLAFSRPTPVLVMRLVTDSIARVTLLILLTADHHGLLPARNID